ncbi:aspartate/glutamate racemase family protein [Lysobacter enzymogenes]|uniref:aspartate/glutamate racemase family protein n=1 Tax=Lysobacter enzymogenes TaxID=69 RepID=UPI001A971602|nr:aspartate/glutamate racemase family protein [Lysobacter enzymogenes]QQP94790.1 aspartate/glutamate racemase family protein [Lysobacter enzymogenes]
MSEPQLRTLGLLGGMSWESTLPYYRLINQTVRERLGGLHSARLLLYSVDFAEIERMQHAGDWDAAGAALGRAACALRDGGAQLLVICTNTMHKVADAVEQAAQLPLLHIADPTGAAIRAAGLHRIGLLGTRFTMEQDFYRQRLQQRHGLEVLVPDEAGREAVHRIIYDELCVGAIREESRQVYREIIAGLVARGAQGVILGCTEIGLLIGDGDVDIPLFDTAALHARAAALASIGQD